LHTYESYLEDDEEDIQFYFEDVVNNKDKRFSIELYHTGYERSNLLQSHIWTIAEVPTQILISL